MQTEIITALALDTPLYFEEYLVHWNASLSAIRDTIMLNDPNSSVDYTIGVNDIIAAFTILHTDTAVKL